MKTASPKVLRLPAVVEVTGMRRSTIYDHVNQDRFPKPIPLGPKSVGWLESEVVEWLEARIADRNKRIAKREKKKARRAAN